MFGFFKKKKKENQFVATLTFDDETYSRFVAELFNTMDPATRVHVLVAYMNLLPILFGTWSEYRKQGVEYTLEQFISQAAERLDASMADEIVSRRWTWFLLASLLGRLERLSRNSPTIANTGAKIWCSIAEDAPRLKILLPNNIAWRQDEKEWFDLSATDDELVQWTINHAMPSIFARLDLVKSFASSRGLFRWSSSSQIGMLFPSAPFDWPQPDEGSHLQRLAEQIRDIKD
jgi:hypothetical protein